MTQHAHELLKEIVEQCRRKDFPNLESDDYFEIFAAQQVLKDARFDLDTDEILSGIRGGGGDGGIDAFYMFANRRLIREDTDTSPLKGLQLNIELLFIQAKNKPSFEESVPSKWKDFVEQCLRLGAPGHQASTLYSESLLDAVEKFHSLYRDALTMQPTLSIKFLHVAHSDHVDAKVKTRGDILCEKTREYFPTAQCEYRPVTGGQLITIFHRRVEKTLPLNVARQFDWNSFERGAYLCVVRLPDFYSFITDGDELRSSLFEANVRDHAPDVKVNKGIQATLRAPQGDDFWWLNNGITIIASNAVYADDQLRITDPLIVNGLQTSFEVFNHFKGGGSRDDKRAIMVKVISNDREDTSDRIISATNSQTPIPSISLHSTEQIHKNIEIALKAQGLYYDRRKNFYRNQGISAANIITISFMAQAVAAVVLQQPDQARARPGTIAEKNYKSLFSDSYPVSLYPACAKIVKRADAFLEAHKEQKDVRLNLVFYLAMYATCSHLRSIKPKRPRIAAVNASEMSDATLSACYAWLHEKFVELGGDDRTAKGPKLTEALKARILGDLKRAGAAK